MLGGIYSDQKCPICGGKFRDDGRNGLACNNHSEVFATRFKVIFKGICRRFKDYQSANRFLTGLRYKNDEGTFDARDYKTDNPLGFENLALQWLEIKEGEVKHSSFVKIPESYSKSCQGLGADKHQAPRIR